MYTARNIYISTLFTYYSNTMKWGDAVVGYDLRLSSGLLRRVVLSQFMDVSEVLHASYIRAVLEAASTLEKPVNYYQATWHNNPDDNRLRTASNLTWQRFSFEQNITWKQFITSLQRGDFCRHDTERFCEMISCFPGPHPNRNVSWSFMITPLYIYIYIHTHTYSLQWRVQPRLALLSYKFSFRRFLWTEFRACFFYSQ
jgi:hypothetical protein